MKVLLLNNISKKGLKEFPKSYQISEDSKDANVILVRSKNLHDYKFTKELTCIARAGAGVNNIPLNECAKKGIVVFNTPGANANSVKEITLASLFLASRNLIPAVNYAKSLSGDDVSNVVEKNKSKFLGNEIKDKVLGVVGLGAIGVLVANAAENLGMKVVGYDPYINVENAHSLSSSIKIYTDLKKMLPICDFISIHVPSIKETNEMFNDKVFSVIKTGTVLLNFSRDKIVKKSALLNSLKKKKLSCYVTDFIDEDVNKLSNVIPVPHLGASTKESEENCAVMAAKQVKEYIENGNIINSVNFPNVNIGKILSKSRVLVMHYNIPKILNRLTDVFAKKNINISNMVDKNLGEFAYTVMDIDKSVDENSIKKSFNFEGIIRVRVINKK